jgi:hypothetical protein
MRVCNRILRIIFLGLIVTSRLVCASAALDQTTIHKEYEDGDFDGVIARIDAFKKNNPIYSKSDSLFIARHLAVVYAANPKTIEIGKHWMHQLLRLTPAADLADMYVNEEIDRIFDKVRREFVTRQHNFGVDTSKIVLPTRIESPGNTTIDPGTREKPALAPDPLQKANAQKKNVGRAHQAGADKKRKKWLWYGVAGTTMVALVTTYVILSKDSDDESNVTKVPVSL